MSAPERPEHLVQIFLPLRDNDGRPFEGDAHGATRRELLERVGGVTAYQRAPAQGLWKTGEGEVARDEVVIFEVMVPGLDRAWWAAYREALRARFRQDALLVRALPRETL
jgi:hypothetical protein